MIQDQPHNEDMRANFAGFWVRFFAIILDIFFLLSICCIFIFIFLLVSKGNVKYPNPKIVSTVVTWIYFSVMTIKYQATLGKMIVGVKVISKDYTKASIGKVLIRELIGKFLSQLTLNIGFIIAGFTKNKQALHDFLAGTYVIDYEFEKKTRNYAEAIIILSVFLGIVSTILFITFGPIFSGNI